MSTHSTPHIPHEGSQREELAAYFLAAPPPTEQTPSQRRHYLQKLHLLGQLERQELSRSVGAVRPLVWGNPAPLIQALLSAAQRLAARLGQPILIFPARETAIGTDTLLHPRWLSVSLCDLLCRACAAAPRQPVWVRLQEQRGGLAVAITATVPFADESALALIKECTRLHDGSLVHCDETIVFTCGQEKDPPSGVRLYGCPTEEELLADTLSPIWSVFYAGLYDYWESSSESSIKSAEESIRAENSARSSSVSSSTTSINSTSEAPSVNHSTCSSSSVESASSGTSST